MKEKHKVYAATTIDYLMDKIFDDNYMNLLRRLYKDSSDIFVDHIIYDHKTNDEEADINYQKLLDELKSKNLPEELDENRLDEYIEIYKNKFEKRLKQYGEYDDTIFVYTFEEHRN